MFAFILFSDGFPYSNPVCVCVCVCVCVSALFELYYSLCERGSWMPMQPNVILQCKVYKREDAKGEQG